MCRFSPARFPAFRDLRAPITAGYMWLVFAWLVINPDLNRPPTTGVAGSIYDLLNRGGRIWVAIATGVVAYFIGSVSQEFSKIMRIAWDEFGPEFGSNRFTIRPDEQLERALHRGQQTITLAYPPEETGKAFERRIRNRSEEARVEADRELDLPATLLVGDQTELFAEVDRLRAEGELRMAVVPPLIGLLIFLVLESSFWWLSMIPIIVILFVQGVQRELDSKKSIADAIRIGRVSSSSVSKFSQWVDETLPAELNQEIERVRSLQSQEAADNPFSR